LAAVALVEILDTKGPDFAFLAVRLHVGEIVGWERITE
jgi:hypothetical protein